MTAFYIALLRGINVGGKNILPMKALVQILEDNDCANIKTYIQSGNVVFQRSKVETKAFAKVIGKTIMKDHGFQPGIVILSAEELKKAVSANPFQKAEAEPKSLHLFFLADAPENPNLKALNQIKTNTESFRLIDRIFYLHAPDGIGRSKLAAQAEKRIGTSATARNWNTVMKFLEMTSGD